MLGIDENLVKADPVLSFLNQEYHKPVVFLPNYGEFGSTALKYVRIVEHTKSPHKIVCCRPGEEAYYPSADSYFHDWTYNLIDDADRWGFLTKAKQCQGGRPAYRQYQIKHAEEDKIITAKIAGPVSQDDFVFVRPYLFSTSFQFEQHMAKFNFELKSKLQTKHVDIVISPRKRAKRPGNNFRGWTEVVDKFHKLGFSVGCVGLGEQSMQVSNSDLNSWDHEDNAGACLSMINNCKLYIGLDTGISHIAALCQAPMIVFQTNNPHWYHGHYMKIANRSFCADLGKNIGDNYDIIYKTAINYLSSKDE